MDNIEALTHATEKGFSCKAKHIKSVYVKEVFQGKTAWQGLVEVFELKDHPKALTAYGWSFEKGEKTELATVLGIPPINDPQSAVQSYVAGNH